MRPNQAVFIDLDNTLIRTASGKKFPISYTDWEFMPNILDKLTKFVNVGYCIVIVSNQGGIEKGFVDEQNFKEKLELIISEMMIYLDTKRIYSYYCRDMKSFYRKPNPGMAYDAGLKYKIHLSKSIMVGDASDKEISFSDSDKMFAHNAGISMYYDIDEFLTTNTFYLDNKIVI